MAYVVPNGHVTDDVTWPRKVLWGSTVGYPSDSLTSSLHLVPSEWLAVFANHVVGIFEMEIQYISSPDLYTDRILHFDTWKQCLVAVSAWTDDCHGRFAAIVNCGRVKSSCRLTVGSNHSPYSYRREGRHIWKIYCNRQLRLWRMAKKKNCSR